MLVVLISQFRRCSFLTFIAMPASLDIADKSQIEYELPMLEIVFAALTAVAGLAILGKMSGRANLRFRHLERLPMQWSVDGRAVWEAPRRVALSFTPVLAAFCLIAAVFATALLDPHPGQEGLEVPAVMALALGFVAIHAFHIWLIGKLVNQQGR